jgi:polyphosphate kinase
VKEQIKMGARAVDPDGLTPREVYRRVSLVAHEVVARQYALLNDEVLPALAKEGIRFLRRGAWNAA